MEVNDLILLLILAVSGTFLLCEQHMPSKVFPNQQVGDSENKDSHAIKKNNNIQLSTLQYSKKKNTYEQFI